MELHLGISFQQPQHAPKPAQTPWCDPGGASSPWRQSCGPLNAAVQWHHRIVWRCHRIVRHEPEPGIAR